MDGNNPLQIKAIGRSSPPLLKHYHSIAPKTRYNAPSHHTGEGARPWFHTFFTTNSLCWPSYGSSSCCMLPGLAEGLRYHRPADAHQAQAQTLPRAQTVRGPDAQAPLCRCVNETTAHPQARLRCHPTPCHRPTDAPVTVDTSMHFCPHAGCDYRGWLGLGNLRANGHPSGGPWRQFHCTSCQGLLSGDPWHDLPRQTGGGGAHRARLGVSG